LKVTHPSGKDSAWIGLLFITRDASFDFNICLQDLANLGDTKLNPAKNKSTSDPVLNPVQMQKDSDAESAEKSAGMMLGK